MRAIVTLPDACINHDPRIEPDLIRIQTKWEAYMREVTDALRHMPAGQLDQKVLNAISDKYKVRIVGPPLGSGVQLELPRKP